MISGGRGATSTGLDSPVRWPWGMVIRQRLVRIVISRFRSTLEWRDAVHSSDIFTPSCEEAGPSAAMPHSLAPFPG